MILQAPNTDVDLPVGQILDLLPVGAMVLDRHLNICEWNQTLADWTGIAPGDAMGTSLPELFPNIGENRYLERLNQVFSTGMPATYSASFHKHFLPIPARHGLTDQLMIQQTEVRLLSQNDRALVTLQDVTFQYRQLEQLKAERKTLKATHRKLEYANEQLQTRNRELDEFSHVASHDLQEPLRKIIAFGQLLQQNCADKVDETAKTYLDFMDDAARRMKALITDLLELSRAGRDTLKVKPISLRDCVDHALSALQIRIAETNAQILCDELPTICGDERLLTQVFQNLIGNAIKFVVDDVPKVSVSAERDNNVWLIRIVDNGIGISDKFAAEVFKPFNRLHSREKFEGTGIGLSICQKTVDRHGGRIWVEKNPEGGSQFCLTLPDTDPVAQDGQDRSP